MFNKLSLKAFLLFSFSLMLYSGCEDVEVPTYSSFDNYPVYQKDDLGFQYNEKETVFKLWSPAVEAAQVHIYEESLEGKAVATLNMERKKDGIWMVAYPENAINKYYTFQVKKDGEWLEEAADPYAVAAGFNGVRSQIIDLASTNPDGWENDQRPKGKLPNDMVIYEIQLRDISIDPNSGIQHKGKYLGLTEKGTQSPEGYTTGLDHLIELGVSHVHIMPTFDFRSLDERLPDEEQKYNWGYDPHLYNVPEGTYSTNPEDGNVRVREFKEMVMALHQAGIRVILDVVYNHTGATEESVFSRLVPGYYYRFRDDGSFSDASACGNETASERPMVRNFILNSVRYWAEEYHLDGFRFDLMGIHDVETMNKVSATLNEIDPTIFVYGEGWTAGDSPLPEEKRAIKANVPQLKQVAAFSDEIRDAIKGHVFTHDAKGFISGADSLEESIKFGVVAGIQHPQIDYTAINYTDKAWAPNPSQCIVYASCHDNHTIWDRLINAIGDASEEERTRMQELALGIVLTAQGVPFLHAGSEFCRTKQGVENSFESPDQINLMDWSRKAQFRPTFEFVKNLIALRKAHPAFRMGSTEAIAEHLAFLSDLPEKVVAYSLNGSAVGDDWSKIIVIYNGNRDLTEVDIPQGNWEIALKGNQVNTEGLLGSINGSSVKMDPASMTILWRD